MCGPTQIPKSQIPTYVTDINVVGSVSNGNDELIMSRDLNRYALRARKVKFYLTTCIPNSASRLLRETFSLGKQQGTWSSGYVTLSYPERHSIPTLASEVMPIKLAV